VHGGWCTRSIFDRYSIVSPKDVEAGLEPEFFHGRKLGSNLGTVCTEMQQPVRKSIDLITT